MLCRHVELQSIYEFLDVAHKSELRNLVKELLLTEFPDVQA